MNFIQEVLNLLDRKQDKKQLDLKRDWFEFGRTKASSVGNPLYTPKMTPHAIKFSDLKCNIIKGLVSGTGTQYTLPMWSTVDTANCNVQTIVDSVFSQDPTGSQGVVSADFLVTGNTVLEGNLLVLGTHTIVESTTTQVADNIFQINSVGAPLDAGIEVIVPAGTMQLVFSHALQVWTVGAQSFQATNLYATNSVFAANDVQAGDNVIATNNVTAGQDVIAGHDIIAGNNATVSNTLSVGVDAFVDHDVVIGHAIKIDGAEITNVTTEAEGLNAEDTDAAIPTTAAVKDYVDAVSLTVVGDTGSESVNLLTEQLAILGGANITTTAQGTDTVLVDLDDDIQLNSIDVNTLNILNNFTLAGADISNVTVSAEGLAAEANDGSIPTTKAVKDYVDANESYVSNVQVNGLSLDITGVGSAFSGSVALPDQGPALILRVNRTTQQVLKIAGSYAAFATVAYPSTGEVRVDFSTPLPDDFYVTTVSGSDYKYGYDTAQLASQLRVVGKEIASGTATDAYGIVNIVIHI